MLEDAGNYITKLPKAEHEALEWHAAMQALILVGTKGGPTMLARIGILRALNRHVEHVFKRWRRKSIGCVVSWSATDQPPSSLRSQVVRINCKTKTGEPCDGQGRRDCLHRRSRAG
jgi:hypothetical protein